MKKIGIVVIACIAALSLVLVGCSSSSKKLVKEGTLTVLTNPEYEPFEYLVGDEIVGFDMDFAKLVAEKLGLKFEVVNMDFDSLMPAVNAGNKGDVIFAGMSVLPEREKQVAFTEFYYVDNMSIAMPKDASFDKAALNNADQTIAVQRGTTGEDWAKENFPNATIAEFAGVADCFAAVQAGKANAVCTNTSVADAYIANTYTDFANVLTEATDEAYAAAVAKNNKALLEDINKAIKELQQEGKIDELKAKWNV
ncbi:MAG: ABC transporter substrate-binding protein [Eggerthellaceae bacterium]|nr:ABC transporter substrate-binding protein [Eggerthellaceae bacterium]